MTRLRFVVVTPAPAGSRSGNRVTAQRWARRLRELGHRARVLTEWRGEACDVLVALHARKSARSALRFRRMHPAKPLIVALGGTDLYPALSPLALTTCEAADRLIVLHSRAVRDLPRAMRPKARVIVQSAEPPVSRRPRAPDGDLLACVLAHLRPVKDPFLPERATRLLPASSRVRVVHAGRAMDAAQARRAVRATERNPRWQWLGELPRGRALALLDR